MKKKNWWKIVLLILAILACIAIPVTLYFTIGQNNSSSSGKVNLSEETVTYNANVKFMNKISNNEPTEIKNGIETNITNKMNSLKLEIDIDYTVSNLDTIQDGVDLNDVNVTVTSVETSTKASGSLIVNLTATEDITDRSNEAVEIPASSEGGLDPLIVGSVIATIQNTVGVALDTGQNLDFGIDYDIKNLNYIEAGAPYTKYATELEVVPMPGSARLTGSFTVTFTIVTKSNKL